MKLNNCLSFKVSSMLIRTLKLKLNPLLVAYTKGFVTTVEVCKFSATISINRRFSI
jgi:hypothetical protein